MEEDAEEEEEEEDDAAAAAEDATGYVVDVLRLGVGRVWLPVEDASRDKARVSGADPLPELPSTVAREEDRRDLGGFVGGGPPPC